MSPRQGDPPGGGYVDDVVAAGGGEDRAWPVDENVAAPGEWPAGHVDGAVGPMELLRFATQRMHEHGTWVRAMVTYGDEVRVGDVYDREMRHLVLDSLVIMSHVAHCYLRHGDADVRGAAEALTTATADLIGRMVHTVVRRQFHTVHRR